MYYLKTKNNMYFRLKICAGMYHYVRDIEEARGFKMSNLRKFLANNPKLAERVEIIKRGGIK